MPLDVGSVVRRRLKGSPQFSLREGAPPPPGVELAPGEVTIGTYANPPPWESTSLLFTTHAIWTMDGQTVERIRLADIVDYETPQVKELGDGVQVRTADGFRFIRIAGSHGPWGKYKDCIALVNIIRAVKFANAAGVL